MGTTILTSGMLRNRFRINFNQPDPQGFIYDYNRLPLTDSLNGTAVVTGSYYDAPVNELTDRFNLLTISGYLRYDFTRSNHIKPKSWLIGGIGQEDLELSGIDLIDEAWVPVVECGYFFDLDNRYYLYSNNAIEVIWSGSGNTLSLSSKPADFIPVTLGSYYTDPNGRVTPYERFTQVFSFTGYSGLDTLTKTPGADPVLYEQTYSSILWQNVDTTDPEIMLDRVNQQVVKNKDIVSGVSARLNRVPWSQQYFQLPLIPLVKINSISFNINEDYVQIISGAGHTTLIGSGISNLIITSGSYVRVSGSFAEDATTLPVIGTISSYPSAGRLLIDDGDYRREIIDYKSISGIYFSGLVRTTGVPHRDGAPVRLIFSGVVDGSLISGVVKTGVPQNGMFSAFYSTSGLATQATNINGLLYVSALSGIARCTSDITYERGLLLCYEPSGSESVCRAGDIDISPLTNGTNHGMLWLSMSPIRPSVCRLSTSRGINSDGTIGPVYAGNDYLQFKVEVQDTNGTPVPGVPVSLALSNPINIGYIDGQDPVSGLVIKTTDGNGVARFAYTPPDTIHGLGYFADTVDIVNTSGIKLRQPVKIEELWQSSGYKTLLYGVWDNDAYLNYSEVSGLFSYTVDGRFELITKVTGGIWSPVLPVALLDVNKTPVTTSGSMVAYLVYPSGSIPNDPNINAYFVSAEKRISIGAMAINSNIASPSAEIIIGLPPFMTGEFLWGPVDDPDTKAFDSLSYLTINPFQTIDPSISRTTPTNIGNIFRILANKADRVRNKFYLGINIPLLQSTQEGIQKIKQAYTFRNKFILEI